VSTTRKPKPPKVLRMLCHFVGNGLVKPMEGRCPCCRQWQPVPLDHSMQYGYRILEGGMLYPTFVCRMTDPRTSCLCEFAGPVRLVQIPDNVVE